jgi:hypothetical protein
MRPIRLLAAAALLMMAACGPAKTKKADTDDLDDPVDTTPKEVSWPERQNACGDTGHWCAPMAQVTPLGHTDDGDDSAGDDDEGPECPDSFQRDPYQYTLDPEATTSSMSGECCYTYTDNCALK